MRLEQKMINWEALLRSIVFAMVGRVCMYLRILMTCAVCVMSVAAVQAEPTVFFCGKDLTDRHYVYGEVSSCATTAGTINLGYAHGIQEGQMVGVLRRSGGNLVPVGIIKLTEVRAGEAFGLYEGAFSLKRDDIVILAAKDLNLWKGGTRSDQLVVKTIINRGEYGYDTADVSPQLVGEVGRDEGLVARKSPPLHVNADVYSTRRPIIRPVVVRGAFRMGTGDLDGALNSLSKEDRDLSANSSKLSIESGLARFAAFSAEGKLTVDDDSLLKLAAEQPGNVDLDEVTADVQRANVLIKTLIRLR